MGDGAQRRDTADVDLVRSEEEPLTREPSASRSGSWREALADPAVRQVFEEVMEAVERERAKEKEQPWPLDATTAQTVPQRGGPNDSMSPTDHDRALADAFDGQAAQFERAPVQSDPAALERLVQAAALPPDSLVLDAGCGPGLVSEALLRGGCRVLGVDLSAEMVSRARKRCAAYGDRARFEQASLFDHVPAAPFDAAISRYVLHHVPDPDAFLRRQVELLRPGGLVVLCDTTNDPGPVIARRLDDIDRARDKTHTHNLAPGAMLDLFARAGLCDIRYVEESYTLDFDEWFDRGTPTDTKANVRARFLAGPHARGFWAEELADGAVRINAIRAIVRGVKP